MEDEHDHKLTLLQLRRMRFPFRNKKTGEIYREGRALYRHVERSGIHWEIAFQVNGWDFAIDLAPSGLEDTEWTKCEYIHMWIMNFDPNRIVPVNFLVGIPLYTVRDLLRFLDAFKVEYQFIPESEVKPLEYIRI